MKFTKQARPLLSTSISSSSLSLPSLSFIPFVSDAAYEKQGQGGRGRVGDILDGGQHGGSPKWLLCCCPRRFFVQGKQRNPSDHRGLLSQCPASTLLAIWIWLFTRREEGRWQIEIGKKSWGVLRRSCLWIRCDWGRLGIRKGEGGGYNPQ